MGYFSSPYHEIALGLAIVLFVISAPPHFSARNTGTILLICWFTLANTILFINRIIWHDHAHNISQIWCDIVAKLYVGLPTAVAAASVVINRRLYKVSRISSVLVSPAEQRRDLIIDLSIGLGAPLLVMIVHVVVQGHRGNIIQGIGCWPSIYNTVPAFPLVFMWPAVFDLIAMVYGMLSLRAFIRRRNTLEEFLNSNNSNASGLNADRYFRLMCFTAVQLTIAFPLTLFTLLTNALAIPVFPWKSWDDTHSYFDRYDQLPAMFIEANPTTSLQFSITIWSVPAVSFIFFLFFGLGREPRNRYKRWFFVLLKPFGIHPPQPNPNRGRRTWWQRLLCRPASSARGTGLDSSSRSRGPADSASLPAFRSDKPITSALARGELPRHQLDPTLTFDFDHGDDDEKAASTHGSGSSVAGADTDADAEVNKALPATAAVVPNPIDKDDAADANTNATATATANVNVNAHTARPSSRVSTSSASSVAGSSRRVSAAIRDVELSDGELREIEARVQRMV